MAFIIGLLTLVMVLDCLIVILLVLIQLPKKDTGGGLAFGGGATDALFGAGSGTVLTKVTKYAATTFFILAVALSIMQSSYHRRTVTDFELKLKQQGKLPVDVAPATAPPTAPTATPTAPTATNISLSIPPKLEDTNVPPAAAATNPAATSVPKK